MKNHIRTEAAQESDFNRIFNRALLTLVIPIALQNLISAAVTSADIMLLGMVNQTAMSAVSLAGQVTFVLTLFYMGLATGAGILTAQYWGRKDVKVIQHILNIACTFSFGISILFFGFSLCFPNTLMRLFTDDGELIRYGSIYLRTVSFSYLAMSLSQMYLSIVRSMENARLSAWVSSLCLIINIILDTVCVLVLFPGRPEKAIIGVALATVIARFIELGCCMLHSAKGGYVRFHLPVNNNEERSLRRDFLKYTIPVQGNYIVWGGALAATATIIGHVNADMVAANSVAGVVKNLAVVLCGGISGGGSVLIGKYLGSGDKKIAIKAGNRINLYALLFGILAGISVLLMKPLVFHLVELTDNAQEYLNGMLYICAYYCIGKSMNSTNIGGIFCAGGDARFGFWCDAIVMWGIILPLSYLSAFVWNLHPIIIYVIISLDEIIKLPIAIIRYRRFKWVNNITRELT